MLPLQLLIRCLLPHSKIDQGIKAKLNYFLAVLTFDKVTEDRTKFNEDLYAFQLFTQKFFDTVCVPFEDA